MKQKRGKKEAPRAKKRKPARRLTSKSPAAPLVTPTRENITFRTRTHPTQISPQEEAVIKDLPFSYGETKMVLLARDPYWAYSYWDFSGETWNWTQRKLSDDVSLKPMIRIHDLAAKRHYNLLVSLEAKNWYLHLGTPDHSYIAELGIGNGSSNFYLIARSNEVRTPRDSPSNVVDPDWSDRDFEEIYRLSGGGDSGSSSPSSLFSSRQI